MMPILLLAASVFLNGVNIDGVRGQSFEKCRAVRIDDKGNLHSTAPATSRERRRVRGAGGAPTIPVAGASIVRPAWPSTTSSSRAERRRGAQYDVDVYVNSKWVRKVRSGDEQIVLDITRFLSPGANKLLFAATKRAPKGARRRASCGSSSARGVVRVAVLIDNPLLECKRSAAETDNVNEEFTVQAR